MNRFRRTTPLRSSARTRSRIWIAVLFAQSAILPARAVPQATPGGVWQATRTARAECLFPGKMEKSGKATYFVQIPLQKFPPGRYSVQVNVLDLARDQVAFTRLPVAIIRPRRATAHPTGR